MQNECLKPHPKLHVGAENEFSQIIKNSMDLEFVFLFYLMENFT